MENEAPFVVTVASEKGGVGKTTLAVNLAVYLKALREDLPVTVASFDNHFSVDGMFAIGPRRGGTVAGLFCGVPAPDLARLGEYGVQFLPSERDLQAPDDDVLHLRRALHRSGLPGVLILDTRPVLDYFTRNALHAADLILVPVKDRPSLVNVAALRGALGISESEERMWLLPSLIDGRLKLRDGIGVGEFLAFSARERGYRVLDTWISKSPKVEGLSTGLSGRIHPVLTRARTTAVHQQFREVASFVLSKVDTPGSVRPLPPEAEEVLPAGKVRRLVAECPVCRRNAVNGNGHFYLHLRSRRRGMLHGACLGDLLEELECPQGDEAELLILETPEEDEGEVLLHFFDRDGRDLSREIGLFGNNGLETFLEGATGRRSGEWFREVIFVTLKENRLSGFLAGKAGEDFRMLRRKALRSAVGKERAGKPPSH